ncbi:hypothetical protein P389DRAFT_207667 [Cystobasidium minutum MCA 4210]|uniref:uncharacterized protein n=1 Tax=Cystobasidium minutum MCA 4210 TaxID=1397322 RepID=UPI0034D011AF|eukprot:jgi/Rhomi1/207667/estExt_Genemark1.C_1_t20110
MAFKFDFDIPEEELENLKSSPSLALPRGSSSEPQGSPTPPASSQATFSDSLHQQVSHLSITEDGQDRKAFDSSTREVTMEEMLEHLPPALSFSAINVPLASTSTAPSGIAILRRDLFDARFQLANQDDDSDDEGSAYGNTIPRAETPPKGFQMQRHLQDNAPSDLIKGVYEGGLKTWEASLDLVAALDEQGYKADGSGSSIEGKRVLEVGCGTAIPTLYLLERLFVDLFAQEHSDSPQARKGKTVVHLQDYNAEVLVYITFCNILLAYWNARKHANTHNEQAGEENGTAASVPESSKRSKEELAVSAGVEYTLDMEEGPDVDEIELSDEFIESFTEFLAKHDIELKFFAGSWQTFQVDEPYNVVLTSETVYELENLPFLVELLKAATKPKPAQGDLTLIACKRVYFGVGGGEVAFRSAVGDAEGKVETVWSGGKGVERTVMQASWAA